MKPWSFTITRTNNGYHWIVEHGIRRHAEGIAGDYDTAWLDSHDAIPDRGVPLDIASDRRTSANTYRS